SNTGEDAPQWIRDLRPSSSQLKILVYLEVRDLEDLWAIKEEGLAILLADAATQTEAVDKEEELHPRLNQFRQYAGQNAENPAGYNDVIRNQARAEENAAGQNETQIRCYNCRGVGHYARNCTVRPRRRDAAYLQTRLLIAQKEEAGIQL
nr:hypothetical protein [Tanacetum cinerariifolium]